MAHSKTKNHDQKFCSPELSHGGDWGLTEYGRTIQSATAPCTAENKFSDKNETAPEISLSGAVSFTVVKT